MKPHFLLPHKFLLTRFQQYVHNKEMTEGEKPDKRYLLTTIWLRDLPFWFVSTAEMLVGRVNHT